MAKMSEPLLAWRRKQPRGAIMQPAAFRKIEKTAAQGGATDPKAVAGAAYWRTARRKFRGRSGGSRKV